MTYEEAFIDELEKIAKERKKPFPWKTVGLAAGIPLGAAALGTGAYFLGKHLNADMPDMKTLQRGVAARAARPAARRASAALMSRAVKELPLLSANIVRGTTTGLKAPPGPGAIKVTDTGIKWKPSGAKEWKSVQAAPTLPKSAPQEAGSHIKWKPSGSSTWRTEG